MDRYHSLLLYCCMHGEGLKYNRRAELAGVLIETIDNFGECVVGTHNLVDGEAA